MKGDDPEIDTAPTPKHSGGRLALPTKILKRFIESILKNYYDQYQIKLWSKMNPLKGSIEITSWVTF